MEESQASDSNSLNNTFNGFSNQNKLVSRSWIKLLKEAKIITKTFTVTDADLIFAKYRTGNFLTYPNFEKALQVVAEKKDTPFDDIVESVIKLKNPSYSGTCPEFTRLFDKKETYTGVHRHGGISVVDKKKEIITDTARAPRDIKGPPISLEDLLDRTMPTVRGLNRNMIPTNEK